MNKTPTIKPEDCDHKAHWPPFDQEAAKNLPAQEVRRRWPRFIGTCETCGASITSYASYAHYLYGDW